MNDVPFEESFLTVAEVADVLRLNPQTVRNWIDAGSLPAVRIGRRVRIKKSDLDRIVDDGYQGAPAPASATSAPNASDFWGGEPVGTAEPVAVQGIVEPEAPERSTGAGRLADPGDHGAGSAAPDDPPAPAPGGAA
ncbi:MAG TPA: helix-turn-helix domain-containing protein [Solirubrobacteraceae bacterium]|nr:helix-turn-helix domain-containing protein [Solirubrobacteraceae bacterium]